MLHMEIIQERLEREYGINIITTAPTVAFELVTRKGEQLMIDNPALLPPPGDIEELREPYIDASLLVPQDYLGAVIQLMRRQARRAEKDRVSRQAGGARVRVADGGSRAGLL